MNNKTTLAPHESLELHELLTSNVIEAKKTHCMLSMIKDSELKHFMESSLDAKKTSIEQLQSFVNSNV